MEDPWDINWSPCHLSLPHLVLWYKQPQLVLLTWNTLRNKEIRQGHVTAIDGESLGADGTRPLMNLLRGLSWGLGWTRREGMLSWIICAPHPHVQQCQYTCCIITLCLCKTTTYPLVSVFRSWLYVCKSYLLVSGEGSGSACYFVC